MGSVNDDYGFKCDICGQSKLPDQFAYIGPKDRDDMTCSPFTEWEQICQQCAIEMGDDGCGLC